MVVGVGDVVVQPVGVLHRYAPPSQLRRAVAMNIARQVVADIYVLEVRLPFFVQVVDARLLVVVEHAVRSEFQ